ncbi:alpha/beta hydrolase [Saccharopolyspora hordei]|uniref:Pimeloyl-ACP methyl ester carboxylesterase n=1 Tax=Saccharopolyspora hordei TaxID=1838 RepID=A0A853AR14_9PSEU|nr:alpha/beta hydrolase [Saccharopolyspora hordei]NYI83421.1 pimeloyl-ACP methyl ester carboxylesterase [Saccharopolyspora hordei]
MRRRALPALGALLAAGATLGAAVPAVAEPALEWQPCPENAEVQCATVPVPLDWEQPDGEQIEVAVARRPATGERLGTLVFMPGGPGGTGVDQLIAASPFSPELSERFDVVSYDPRGFGRSAPLQCDTELVSVMPDIRPGPERFAELQRYNQEVAADCRARSGPLIDHVDAVSVARDIDALRQALGEEQLSLYGISYGTLVGQMYAEQFPERVRALVLDSVMDHSLSAGDFYTTQAEAAEDSFAEFAKWCAEDAQCALHGEDVGAVFDELYERAERGELHAPGDPSTPIGPVELSRTAMSHFYQPDWEHLAVQLKALRDDQSAPTALAVPETVPYSVAAFCGDWTIDIDTAEQYAQVWQRQAEAAPHMRFGVGGGVAWGCVDWPSPVQNPQHVPQIRTEAPVLVANALHDPATGYNWATTVDQQIEQATLLTYDGWGHGVYSRSECTTSAVDRYLVDGVVPPQGTHCAAVPPTDNPPTKPYVGWDG